MKKRIFYLLLEFIIIVFLGFFLILLTYLIPSDKVKTNSLKSDLSFSIDKVIKDYDTTTMDNFTDSIILSELVYENNKDSLLKKAMLVEGIHYEPTINLSKYLNGEDIKGKSYERYWHGQMVFLKPFFSVFDYSDFKVINFFLQTILLLVVISLMIKNKLKKYIIPFIISVLLIHPSVIGISLQYSPMYYLMLISSIIILEYHKKIQKNKLLPFLFLAIGMITSYIDFLTYPLVTFGIPIIFVCILNLNNKDKKTSRVYLDVIVSGVAWVIGYVGMWASKWIISSFVLHENCIKQAIDTIFFRTSASDFSRIDAITKNVLIYKEKAYLVVFLIILIYFIYKLIKNMKIITKEKIVFSLVLLLIAVSPIVWYFFTSNHSYIHYYMTYREMIILFFGLFCWGKYLVSK